jgi:hypothetical protein
MKTQFPALDDLHLNLGIAARHSLNHLTVAQSDLVIAVSRELIELHRGKSDTSNLRQLIDAMRPWMASEDAIAAIAAFEHARVDLAVWTMP